MIRSCLAVVCLVLLAGAAALADQASSRDAPLAFGDDAPVAADALGSARAGEGTLPLVASGSEIAGKLSDNTVASSTSGSNVIHDHAFEASMGLPTVIQNSGNNVLIQSSLIVNVSMTP